MAENFDAHGQALELENLAKTYLDNKPSNYPLEQSAIRDDAGAKLQAELQELALHQPKLDQVGKELEKLGAEYFSTLPNVKISASFGHLTGVEFSPSFFDWSATNYDRYDLELPKNSGT